MAEPDDLLSKADALMARQRPGRSEDEPYPAIPLLEEVVDLAPEGDDLPLLTELVEPDLLRQGQALAADMQASLLAALQPEIDALIEERLKQSLSPLVERMFHELRGDLQLIAREILADAIQTAVQQELDRRKQGV
jgi:hypothetical protein